MLKVRSGSQGLLHKKSNNQLQRVESKALDDPYENFDYFYKIIVIGDENVGKSNLLHRITKNQFVENPKATYGVEFETRVVPLPNSNQRVCA